MIQLDVDALFEGSEIWLDYYVRNLYVSYSHPNTVPIVSMRLEEFRTSISPQTGWTHLETWRWKYPKNEQ